MPVPLRQVRAVFDDTTITVYQAYSPHIAEPAAAAGSFAGTPFKLERMTWVKPSFLWMMYRSGWASKPGQERVLAVRMTRSGFEEALAQACLSHPDPAVDADHDVWRLRLETSPVRVQWDPERDVDLNPLPWRSIQVGATGPAAHDYVHRWTVGITDITADVHALRQSTGAARLPAERPYPLPADVAAVVGASLPVA